MNLKADDHPEESKPGAVRDDHDPVTLHDTVGDPERKAGRQRIDADENPGAVARRRRHGVAQSLAGGRLLARRDRVLEIEDQGVGAGSELTDWKEIPGYAYRVQKGDKIRIETMVHNPTTTAYDNVYLEVKIPYADTIATVKSVYPTWMDV